MTVLQATWAPNTTTYRTFGRDDEFVVVTPPAPTYDNVVEVSGKTTYSILPPVTTFTHPGVLLGTAQLDFVKAKIAAGTAPWTTEYNRMLSAKCDLPKSLNNTRAFTDLSWVPKPWAQVGRGSSGSNSEGDQDEQADAIAAYANALRWYYTGNRAAAQKAIQICNAWSSTLQSHKFDVSTYSDGLLQAGWTGSIWPRAAEIMRYTFTPSGGETALDAAGFAAMLQRAHIPRVKDGWSGGGYNWLLVMADALIACAVYCEDQVMYQRGLDSWRRIVPASIWMTGDVNRWSQLSGLPISMQLPPTPDYIPPGWSSSTGQSTTDDRSTTNRATYIGHMFNPTSWPSGLQLETGRDPWHMSMGFAAIMNAAETARIQGDDLYGEQQNRLATSIEFTCDKLHNAYIDGAASPYGLPFTTAQVSQWGTQPTNLQRITWGAAYNHFHNRLGLPMTQTGLLLNDYVYGTGYRAALHIAFEPLTHMGTP